MRVFLLFSHIIRINFLLGLHRIASILFTIPLFRSSISNCSNFGSSLLYLKQKPARKTLVLDLDETLIHSLLKDITSRSGRLIEVKLPNQHAILYYVNKRPYCDLFLKIVINSAHTLYGRFDLY